MDMKALRKIQIILFLVFCAATAHAQLVIPEVSLDLQRLPEEAQQKLLGLDSIVTLYFADATQPWNRDDFGYDVPVQINIYMTDYSPNPQEDKYKANIIVTNKQETRFDDKRWEFGLRTPVTLPHGQYHPFFSVMEFYVWMIIGVEEDKQEKLGGRPFFDKAKQVFLQSSGSLYYFGWDKRSDLVRDYIADENNTARELSFYYFTGVYFDSIGDYASSGSYLFWAMLKLSELSISQQELFLESHHVELTAALGRAIIPRNKLAALKESLIRIDPTRRTVYESIPVPEEGQ
jgi:hypothetical protein